MTRLDESAKGVFIISATPFTDDGSIDFAGVGQLADFYLDRGVHGMTILGMMGEANKLTAEEAEGFATAMLRAVNGRVPVVVGVSASALVNVVGLARRSMDAGAAGVMLSPTTGLKTDDQVYAYVEKAVEALGGDVPIVYQDYPQSTGVFLSPTLWKRLADDFPTIVMLKHEDCPGLNKLSNIRRDGEGRRRTSILVGNGALYYLEEMERGADGAMTGFGFPEMLVGVYDDFVAGERDRAADLFDAYLPLTRYEQQPVFGLPVRKEILRRRGALRSAAARYPVPPLGEGAKEIDRLLSRVRRRLLAIDSPQAGLIAA